MNLLKNLLNLTAIRKQINININIGTKKELSTGYKHQKCQKKHL